MKKPAMAIPLIERLNRHLPRRGRRLYQCKLNTYGYRERGDYYIVDTRSSLINAQYVDIANPARAEAVLEDEEEVVV